MKFLFSENITLLYKKPLLNIAFLPTLMTIPTQAVCQLLPLIVIHPT